MKSLSCARSLALVLSLASITALVGCGSSFSTNKGIDYASPGPLNNGTGDVHGGAFGGRQPIKGSHLYMFGAPITSGTYSVPTSGNPTGTTTTVAPISLLGNNGGCNASQHLYTDASGGPLNGFCYYVTGTGTETFPNNNTSVQAGEFNLAGLYKCDVNASGGAVTGQQVWLYSVGGDPGSNSTSTPNINQAAALTASLGTCPGTNFAGTLSFIYMNEVSTTAFAYAVAGFAYDAVHITAPTTNTVGLGNAFANAAQLYDIGGGADPGDDSGARYKTPNGFGSNPYVLINSVADVLASCINTTYSDPGNTNNISTPCNNLLYSNNGTGALMVATDTASAAIYIAQHPSNANIFGTIGSYIPWHPAFSDSGTYTNPNNGVVSTIPPFPMDLTAAIVFTGSGYLQPTGIAAAGNGHVFVTMGSTSTSGSIAELSPVGAITNSAPVSAPTSIVIDSLGNLWSVGATNGNLYEISNSSGVPTVSGTVHSYLTGDFSEEAPPQLPLALAAGGTTGTTPPTIYVADYAALNSSGMSSTPGQVDKVTLSGGVPSITFYDRTGTAPYMKFGNSNCSNNVNGIEIDNSSNLWTSNSAGFVCRTKAISGGTGANLAVNFSGSGSGAVTSLSGLAVDYPGNAWASSPSGLVYVTSAGSGSKALTAGGLEKPSALAVDGNGNVFALNASAYAYNTGCSSYPPSITEYSAITSAGPNPVSPSQTSNTFCGGYQANHLSFPNGIAVDVSGNVWVTNSVVNTTDPYNNTVSELIGVATPTLSPTLQTPGKPEIKTGSDDETIQ
jgi:hypothetical protein